MRPSLPRFSYLSVAFKAARVLGGLTAPNHRVHRCSESSFVWRKPHLQLLWVLEINVPALFLILLFVPMCLCAYLVMCFCIKKEIKKAENNLSSYKETLKYILN